MAISQQLKDACERLKDKAIKDLKTAKRVEVGIIDDQEVAAYATYQEYGWVQRVTKKQSYWFRGQGLGGMAPLTGSSLVLPPRPFLRSTLQAEGDKWSQVFANAVRASGSIEYGLQMVGVTAVGDVKTTIATGGNRSETFAPRAPLTMALYSNASQGHATDGTGNLSVSKPLVRTGAMLNAIGFQLANGSGGD